MTLFKTKDLLLPCAVAGRMTSNPEVTVDDRGVYTHKLVQ
jgi:hypothetical protein